MYRKKPKEEIIEKIIENVWKLYRKNPKEDILEKMYRKCIEKNLKKKL